MQINATKANIRQTINKHKNRFKWMELLMQCKISKYIFNMKVSKMGYVTPAIIQAMFN